MSEEKTLFEKLYEASEEGFSRVAKEALSHPVVSEAMKKTLRNAAATKGNPNKIAARLVILSIPNLIKT